jgi:hypothetical protein
MARAERQDVDCAIDRFGEELIMTDIQIEFSRDRLRAQVGQKVDATPLMVVSATSNATIPFGALVVYDESDAFLCKLPANKTQLDKPLGITLRQLHCEHYGPKNSIAALRKGRVWVEAEKVNAPGDVVYIRFAEDGSARFIGEKKDNTLLRGALFLEKSDGGLVPIEVTSSEVWYEFCATNDFFKAAAQSCLKPSIPGDVSSVKGQNVHTGKSQHSPSGGNCISAHLGYLWRSKSTQSQCR